MKNGATVYEAMAVAIAKELRDEETWFTGLATGDTTVQILARLPLVAMALAQATHAPNSFMLVSGWLSNPVLSEIPTGMETEFGTSMHFWRSECRGATHVMGRGDIDVGFGSAAQIDQYGNCNIVCIGDYYKPRVRLIGPINQPGHFSQFGREIVILDHDPRNFVERVDFVSGAGYLDGPGARERAGLDSRRSVPRAHGQGDFRLRPRDETDPAQIDSLRHYAGRRRAQHSLHARLGTERRAGHPEPVSRGVAAHPRGHRPARRAPSALRDRKRESPGLRRMCRSMARPRQAPHLKGRLAVCQVRPNRHGRACHTASKAP